MFRPEVIRLMQRWADAAFGLGLAALGIWIAFLGGWVLLALGVAVGLAGLGWAILGVQRAKFAGDPDAPGMIEITEGQLRYLHPVIPGEISLADLAELRLVRYRGRKMWRLRDFEGASLLLPVDASGAAALFDAFSALPGLAAADLVAAIEGASSAKGQHLPAAAHHEHLIWRRQGQGETKV